MPLSAESIPTLLAIAWLLPLASFAVIVLSGRALGQTGKFASYLATGAIVGGFVVSLISLVRRSRMVRPGTSFGAMALCAASEATYKPSKPSSGKYFEPSW